MHDETVRVTGTRCGIGLEAADTLTRIRNNIALVALASLAAMATPSTLTVEDGSTARYLDTSEGRNWPGYSRTFGEQHYSPLAQISHTNIHALKPAWPMDLGPKNSVTQPIAVDGVLYFATAYNTVQAVDVVVRKGTDGNSAAAGNLWAHDNLLAWAVVPFDAKRRGPEERARMLERLGFRNFAYDWRDKDVPTFDEEIEALQRHGVNLLAWWFPLEADDPRARATLEVFKRHGIRPQLWVPQSFRDLPQTPEEWGKLLPKGVIMPNTKEELDKLSERDKAEIKKAYLRLNEKDLPKTSQERKQRLEQETDRIHALVRLAAPYGSKVELYSHNGWFGMTDNLIAVIERLRDFGVTDVGMVYNFLTARDELHDDTADFHIVWKNIKPYVVAVNITGMRPDGDIFEGVIYPSQGDRELEMMRTIRESGWIGPVGLIAEKGGDAEVTLKNDIAGFDWLAAELNRPGSGGSRPLGSAVK
jgi:hypothetical protein